MKKLGIIVFVFFFFLSAKSQQNEFFFRFIESNKNTINTVITRIISIDRIRHDTVYAYANSDELKRFEKLGYKYILLPHPSTLNTKSISMATTIDQMANWDRYPTYEVYRTMMKKFEQDYPSICKLDSIGTTTNGHKLYVVKISNNVTVEEPEVEVFYTSTMHGDETTGYILMLRLIDYMLSRYSIDTQITSMLNSMVIYINPDANPDGTYMGGDNTVSGAIRYNANYVDINRNFPDPRLGDHPNGAWTPETQIMMNFASLRHFTVSANFHGGSEVVNYPWDTWISSSKIHPDNNWFINFSKLYADSVQANGSVGYFTDVNINGITNGGDWYVVAGGRQDYMNWWHHCKEVTIELSMAKTPSSNLLPNFWNYNKAALLGYLESATKGFNGIITNTSGNPVKAKVFISGHDADSSYIYSSQTTGFYARPIEPGTWQVTYSAPGYISQTQNVVVNDWEASVIKNITLIPEYTVTFSVNHLNSPVLNANVHFNGVDKLTSSSGLAIFTNIPEGTGYGYTISLSGYHTAIGQFNVTDNKTFNVDLVPDATTVYSVTFNVTHQSLPVANATIIFNGIEQQTPSNGTIVFANIPQGIGYNYTVSKTGYVTQSTQTDVSTNKTIDIDLSPITYSVIFTVKLLGVAIVDANVDFNGTIKQTGIDGTVSFPDIPNGNGYGYTVSKLGYKSVIGQVDLTSDKNIAIELLPLYNVIFNVSNQGLPVANATIDFNSLSQQTDISGSTSFSNVVYGMGYNYSVSLTGYHGITSQVDVLENKSINVELTPVGVLEIDASKNLLYSWPNPFNNNINFQFDLEKPSNINLSVYSMDGRKIAIIADGLYHEGLNTITWSGYSSSLNAGSYIVVLNVDKKTFSQIIVHIK
ncbi:MAG: T9SS type A sorting domain-containing protein [Bacteroidales bacterium]|nr:T9SS type A sorting domain-containing protein [Bacteroidales bacterium]